MASDLELNDLFDRADIVTVAQQLGLQVDRTRTNPRKAICPFHKDSDPSLRLYDKRSGSDRGSYHCFACAAHGDVIDLVRGVKGLDFRDAVGWLCELVGLPVPSANKIRIDRRAATDRFAELLKQSSKAFDTFAKKRGYSSKFLRDRGVGVANLQSLLGAARDDKQLAEALIEIGIASVSTAPNQSTPNLFPLSPLRSFYLGQRVVFPIHDADGHIAGYAARALGDEKPKYLFSRGFKRAKTVYGAQRALQAAKEGAGVFDLYLTEGILDALRIESFEMSAVALLGAQMTAGQADIVGSIIKQAIDAGRIARVILFLDPDEAGRKGTVATFSALNKLQARKGPFDLRVVSPVSQNQEKQDPDAYLRELGTDEARSRLVTSLDSLQVVGALFLNREVAECDLSKISPLEQATAAKRIADSIDPVGLSIYLDIAYPPDRTDLWAAFGGLLRRYIAIRSVDSFPPRPPEKTFAEKLAPLPSDDASLLRSVELARSTAKRREYPVDEAAFERLEIAGSALFYIHAARLREGAGPVEPYPARHVPKDGGRYRTKCGPVSEDIVQQQYLLNGLLRRTEIAPEIAQLIPAVRYQDGVRQLTGPHRAKLAEPLSFAYQVDQDIADGIAPPRREGLFRPYYNCWRDFINFIDARIRRMDHDIVHILRLDISGFYDNLRRTSVRDALLEPLKSACAVAGEHFLPLIVPHAGQHRAERILDLMLAHSFGYRFRDPKTGDVRQSSPDFGIPQGPDLSAYLANVALFDLDVEIGAEIDALDKETQERTSNAEAIEATYARYVDDIVIVCGDRRTARRLQRQIADHLARMGLRLNRKTEPPPPLTQLEARAWVTDNRSGVGFSGPLDEVAGQSFFDPLHDAGDVDPDRKFALGLLHDPVLEAQDIYCAGETHERARLRAIEKIRIALSAKELRHNDRVKAFGWFWRMAAADNAAAGAEAVAKQFCRLVFENDPKSERDARKPAHVDLCMAALDAFENLMRLERDRDSIANNDARLQVTLRDSLASLDVVNLVRTFVADLVEVGATTALRQAAVAEFFDRYDVTIQVATTLVAACDHALRRNREIFLNLDELPQLAAAIDKLGSVGSSLRRFRKTIRVAEIKQVTLRVDRDAAIFRALHADIAEWQRWASSATNSSEEAIDFVEPVDVEGEDGLLHTVGLIRDVWRRRPMPSGGGSQNPELTRDTESVAAATALLNIVSSRAGDFIEQRPDILVQLIGNAKGLQVQPFLPRPPGLKTPEVLFICEDIVLHVTTTEAIERPNVFGLEFGQGSNIPSTPLILREAYLRGFRQLIASDDTSRPYGATPGDIACAYRAYFQCVAPSLAVPEPVLLLSAHSFLFRGAKDTLDHHVIAWTTSASEADDFASVRRHGSLVPWPVYRNGAPYWRFGWALCDAFEIAEEVHNPADLEAKTVTDASDEPQGHYEQLSQAFVKQALKRLTGADRYGPGKIDPSGLPSRITRGLDLLDAFEEARGLEWTKTGQARAATISLASYADGIMVSERIERPGQPSRPGGLSALLARASRNAARGANFARLHWDQENVTNLGDIHFMRRTAGAWIALAQRICNEVAPCTQRVRETVAPLLDGLRLLGLSVGLRGFVHDLVGIGGEPLRARLANLPLDVEALAAEIGADAVLVEVADTTFGSARNVRVDLSDEVAEALHLLERDLKDGAGMSAMTPLGWAVIAGGLARGLSLDGRLFERERAELIEPKDPEAVKQALCQLFNVLTRVTPPETASRDWADPRQTFSAYEKVSELEWAAAFRALCELDAAVEIRIEDAMFEQEPFRRLPSSGETFAVSLPGKGTRALPGWAVLRDTLGRNDRNAATLSDRDRLAFPATISVREDQLLGASVASDNLALAAFGRWRRPEQSLSLPIDEIQADAGVANSINALRDQEALVSNGEDEINAGTNLNIPSEPTIVFDSRRKEILDEIARTQHSAWEVRAKRSPRMHRIAILQWDVTDSYFFPEKEHGNRERFHKPVDVKNAWWSLEEMRRRATLEKVLEACRHFKVEGLVLPEYCVRPETVNWLFTKMRDAEYPKAIWPGSFRIPSGEGRRVVINEVGAATSLAPADQVFERVRDPSKLSKNKPILRSFSSVVPLLYRIPKKGVDLNTTGSVGIAYRLKRHPALAFQEFIYPDPDNQWRPLGEDFWGHMHLQTFTAELVCAEMFLHASHANRFALCIEIEKLRERFGIRRGSETIEDDISKELLDFSRATSYSERRNAEERDKDNILDALQRSILIIPSWTSRSADYHLFGQAQHLGSGLVTVFVNSSHPDACGGSAFIGLDGWKNVEGKLTPYGEIGPGIFNFDQKEFGPLKKGECAVVIADVDPLHTTDHKPRPQYQPRPLELIAHLPLIFETQKCSDTRSHRESDRAETAGLKSPTDHPDGKRVKRLVHLPFLPNAGSNAISFKEAMASLWPAAHESCKEENYGADVQKFLLALESFADDRYWLAERTKSLLESGRRYLPGFPPAAIVDWLYVEDGWSAKLESEFKRGPSATGPWIDISAIEDDSVSKATVESSDVEPEASIKPTS